MPSTTVNNTDQLTQALAQAHGGDTILLATGNYSSVSLNRVNFASNVTITSADPAHSAVITDMNVYSSSSVTFSGIEFSSDPTIAGVSAVAKADPYPIRVTQSSNVIFNQDSFHGTMNNDSSDDRSSLLIDRSAHVTVNNSTFQQAAFGLVHSNSNDLTINHNEFKDIRSDGVHGGSSGVTITNNYFHDFHPVGGASSRCGAVLR